MNHLRRIPLPHAHNLRDLGGYPTIDGRQTRWFRLFRSDSLAYLDAGEWDALAALGIRTVIDLRSTAEADAAPVTPPPGITVQRFLLMRTLESLPDVKQMDVAQLQRAMGSPELLASMALDYGDTIFGNLECCVDILKAITKGLEGGGVVFMCSAGKDRTGIVAALVLTICRVIREDIIADYAVSNTYNTNGINRILTAIPPHILGAIPNVDALAGVLESRPQTMIALLDRMDADDIGAELADHGFTTEDQAELREAMTQTAGQ